VPAPWQEFFIQHHDDEFRKIAIATLNRQAQAIPSIYGKVFHIGAGWLLFSQVLLESGNAKVIRFYSRLLANLGALVDAHFLEYRKEEKDFGIPGLMAQLKEDHQDYAAMLAYYTASDYLLNNLGEGVFGWMKRLDKFEGVITVPHSTGMTAFITAFVDSEINRDPSLRLNNELPDSSIVPDLFVEIDRPFQVFINGSEFARADAAPQQATRVEDVVLRKGLNRFAIVAQAGPGDIHVNVWFENKFGDPVAGLKYPLTLD
jgi:beta-galactosidase